MTTNQNFRIYEAIAHEDAMAAAERRELTPEQRASSARIYEAMRAQLARAAPGQQLARVRPSILAMARDAIVRRLQELFALHPDAMFAHRDLKTLTDYDLRTALEDAESLVERNV